MNNRTEVLTTCFDYLVDIILNRKYQELSYPQVFQRAAFPQAPERILIIQLRNLGDIVNTYYLIPALLEKYPDVKVDILTEEVGESFCRQIPQISSVYVFPVSRFETLKQPELEAALKALLETIPAYDLLLNYYVLARGALLASLISAKVKLGAVLENQDVIIRGNAWMYYYFQHTLSSSPLKSYNILKIPELYYYSCELQPKTRFTPLMTHKKDLKSIEECPEKNKKWIAINFGANNPLRRWPPEKFRELMTLLADDERQFILLGVEKDKSYSRVILDNLDIPVIDLVGKTTIPQLLSLLSVCDLLISNDTGTAHLASAVGLRTFVICGPATIAPWGNAGHLSIRKNVNCDYICRTCKKAECMAELDAVTVVQAVYMHESMQASRFNLFRTVFNTNPHFRDIDIHFSGYEPMEALFVYSELTLLPDSIDRAFGYTLLKLVYLYIWNQSNAETFIPFGRKNCINLLKHITGADSYYNCESIYRKLCSFYYEVNKKLKEAIQYVEAESLPLNVDQIKQFEETSLSYREWSVLYVFDYQRPFSPLNTDRLSCEEERLKWLNSRRILYKRSVSAEKFLFDLQLF